MKLYTCGFRALQYECRFLRLSQNSVFVGVLSGRLFLYDGQAFSTRVIRLRAKQTSCVVCGTSPTITKLIDYTEFCGTQPHDKHEGVSVSLYKPSDIYFEFGLYLTSRNNTCSLLL